MGGNSGKSGAAERMAYSFIKAVGKKKRMGACDYRMVYRNPGICGFGNCDLCASL